MSEIWAVQGELENVQTTTTGFRNLKEARRCEITREINGIYELVLEMPFSAYKLATNYYIKCFVPNADEGMTEEYFSIYKIDYNNLEYITYYARQISYQLTRRIITTPFSINAYPSEAVTYFEQEISDCPFTFTSELSDTTKELFSVSEPSTAYQWLIGNEGSLVNLYGGEWDFVGLDCILKPRLGSDKSDSVIFRYDKNLIDFNIDDGDHDLGVYSVLIYYKYKDAQGTEQFITNTGRTYGEAGNVKNKAVICANSYFGDTIPTTEQLYNFFVKYRDSDEFKKRMNKKASYQFIFEDVDEDVYLGDTIAIMPYNGASYANARIRKIVWDVLNDRYISVELGDKPADLYSDMTDISTTISSDIKAKNNQIFKIKQYQSQSYSISANGRTNITGANFQISTPENYRPVSIGRIATGSTDVVMRAFNYKATGTTPLLSLVNLSSTALSGLTATVEILYLNNDYAS